MSYSMIEGLAAGLFVYVMTTILLGWRKLVVQDLFLMTLF